MRVTVADMSCAHCVDTIEKAVAAAGGRASVDLAAHRVTVEGLDGETALEVIRAAGFTPVLSDASA